MAQQGDRVAKVGTIDFTDKLNDGWLGSSDSEPPVLQSWGLARGSTPATRLSCMVYQRHRCCLYFANCRFPFLHKLVESSWIVRRPHRGEEILIVDYSA